MSNASQVTINQVTICSTARLVRGVNHRHQQQQLANGVQQWQKFDVCTLPQWLDSVISRAILLDFLPDDAVPSIVLNPLAEAYLWEQAISSCLEKHEAAVLFDIRALARSAIEANQLMWDWQIDESEINQQFIGQETRQFLRWRHTFQSLCQQKSAVEEARLTSLQISLLENKRQDLALPQHIVLAGFDRITPLQNRLFDFLNAQGVELEFAAPTAQKAAKIDYYALNDVYAECRAAVAWAKQKLALNPSAQLAIISPALSNIRRELADLLDDTFHPQTLQPVHFEMPRCYDFSLGLALIEYPLVHSALQLLRFSTRRADLNFDEVTPLLHDIHWGNGLEVDARAQFDAYLRQRLSASYSLDTLLKKAKELHAAERLQLSILIEHLELVAQFQSQSQLRQLPSAWVMSFVKLLESLDWANSRPLSSHEYQSQQAFFKSLKEFSALDIIVGKMTASEATQKITELCTATIFQAEAKGDIHIQLLGLLETPAVQLDAVWAINMNDQHWPPPVKLNPLLPAELQRSRGIPNASASIQNTFASLVHQRLLQSAPEIVFSYAVKEDERELRPSPLLAIDRLELPQLQLSGVSSLAEILAQPASMQMLADDIAPGVLEGEKIGGGVKLFATQAICPAWAFYQYRLGANKLETPIDGFDSMARGSLLHQVLQNFWQNCQNLSNLQAMNSLQRSLAIDVAIQQSIKKLQDDFASKLPPPVLLIEQQRLTALLETWLDIEAARADFEVAACEQSHVLDIDGLTVKLTIDRIDRLADGRFVVIDYKTSSAVSNKSWADDRISEPQLPIYAALALQGEQVAAVCFAKVRSDETKFIGLSAEGSILPDVPTLTEVKASSVFNRFENWETLLARWQSSLHKIAQEIKTGGASVTFSNEADLTYCDVKPLLRLPERHLQFERQATTGLGNQKN